MTLTEILEQERGTIVDEATAALRRAHLAHYDAWGAEACRDRLDEVLGLVVECAAKRTLEPMSKYGETVAAERFRAGFEIGEVQTGFNVLEEAIWHVVVPLLPLDDLAECMGRIGTIVGVGRNALARTWVALASGDRLESIDMDALFRGAAS